METEILRIFDEHHSPIGTATREVVHSDGYWHETFHCWVLEGESIFFQIRSLDKKDYPGLLDITAAGHLLANERVEDGVREIQEEIGLEVAFADLIPLGIIKSAIRLGTMTDLEFGHVFVLIGQNILNRCTVNMNEVSGMVKSSFQSFYDLIHGKTDSISVEGFILDSLGEKLNIQKSVKITDMVSHDRNYLSEVVNRIQKIIRII